MKFSIVDQYDHFIFDLDNTLIEEDLYLHVAYKEIATYTSMILAEKNDPDVLYQYLYHTYHTEGRTQLLNKYIQKFSLPDDLMPELLQIMRTIKLSEKLHLIEPAGQLLKTLISSHKTVAIATNGNKQQQQNKVNQTEWKDIASFHIPLYFAADYEPKPSPNVLLAVVNDLQLSKDKTIFVGDSITDEQSAISAGINFAYLSSLTIQ
jgi:HAD superfamily hydrolase (TIGR01549 family)